MPELERAQPWWAALRLLFALAAQRGMTVDQGIEKLLWQRTKADGMKTIGMEDPSAGLRAIASASTDDQARFLSYIAESTDSVIAELASMISAWRGRQLQPFECMLAERLRRFPGVMRKLISQRNEAWAPQILKIANDGVPSLIVAGVLHYVGPSGLPSLLGQSGRTILAVDHVTNGPSGRPR